MRRTGWIFVGLSFLCAGFGGVPVRAQQSASTYHWVVVASPATLPGLKTPAGLAIDRRGPGRTKWLYTTDTTTGRVYKFGTGGHYLGRWQVTKPGNPAALSAAGVAVGGTGNVFVTDPARHLLNKYSPSGARLAQWQPDTATGPLDTPVTVAVDANGNVYVGDPIKDRIVRFNPDGTVGASWAMSWTNGTGKSSPIATAFFEGGLLVAAVCGATSCTAGHGDLPYNVQWSNSDGRVLSEAVGATPHGGQAAGEQPWIIITGLAGDAKGNRYIAGLIETPSRNPQPGVLEYSHGGALVGSWTLKGTGLPEGITVDNAGTVYVTYGNRILRLVR